MTHPCAGHPCDHCFLCDVVGICCQTVRAGAATDDNLDDALRQVIIAERHSTADLADLIRVEAASAPAERSAPLLLPASEPPPRLFAEHRLKGQSYG